MEYFDIYKRRINRYGLNFQERIQKQREEDFSSYLFKTIYRVEFWYEDKLRAGSLEPLEQDYSEVQHHLLVPISLDLPSGTVIEVENERREKGLWMVWWKEHMEASGYNRYRALKMNQLLEWEFEGNNYSQRCFLTGPGRINIKPTIQSKTASTILKENDNAYSLITPYHKDLKDEVYFEIKEKDTTLGFSILEVDILTTPGVAYITLDPVPLREKPDFSQIEKDENTIEKELGSDTFWFGGIK